MTSTLAWRERLSFRAQRGIAVVPTERPLNEVDCAAAATLGMTVWLSRAEERPTGRDRGVDERRDLHALIRSIDIRARR